MREALISYFPFFSFYFNKSYEQFTCSYSRKCYHAVFACYYKNFNEQTVIIYITTPTLVYLSLLTCVFTDKIQGYHYCIIIVGYCKTFTGRKKYCFDLFESIIYKLLKAINKFFKKKNVSLILFSLFLS